MSADAPFVTCLRAARASRLAVSAAAAATICNVCKYPVVVAPEGVRQIERGALPVCVECTRFAAALDPGGVQVVVTDAQREEFERATGVPLTDEMIDQAGRRAFGEQYRGQA